MVEVVLSQMKVLKSQTGNPKVALLAAYDWATHFTGPWSVSSFPMSTCPVPSQLTPNGSWCISVSGKFTPLWTKTPRKLMSLIKYALQNAYLSTINKSLLPVYKVDFKNVKQKKSLFFLSSTMINYIREWFSDSFLSVVVRRILCGWSHSAMSLHQTEWNTITSL